MQCCSVPRLYHLSLESEIHYMSLIATVCLTHCTAIGIKNCSKSTPATKVATENIPMVPCAPVNGDTRPSRPV